MANDIRLDLLLKEIRDVYVQENFRKLERYLSNVEKKIADAGGSSGNTIVNNNNTFINSPWDQIESAIISSSSVGVIHSVNVDLTDCGELKVCFKEQGGSGTKSLNIKYRKTDTDVVDQVYAKSGVMDTHAAIVRTPTTIDLQITNNELFNVDVGFTIINI